jgi:uncharacterized protein (TIGR03437 family)
MLTFPTRKKFWLLLAGLLLCGGVVLGSLQYQRAHQLEEAREAASAEDEFENEGRVKDSWFYEQRAYPLATIPPRARLRAFEELEIVEARQRMLNLRPTEIEQLSWQPLGPNPIGQQIGQFPINFGEKRLPCSGRISALALHPQFDGTNNRTVYLGAAQGGVWRTDDGGDTWRPLTDTAPSLAIGDIAIDPTNPNVVWASTGEGNPASGSSYYGAGLLKTTDGGNTWQVITGPNSTIAPVQPAFINAGILKIEIDPTNPNTVYITTGPGRPNSAAGSPFVNAPLGQRGIWKTTDGGQTWTNLNVTDDGGRVSATDVITDPLNRQRVYAAMLAFGIYRSDNGGQTWTYLEGGLPAEGFQRIALAIGPPLAPSQNSTLYAAYAANNSDLLDLYRSTNNGQTWTAVTLPQEKGQANYNLAITTDPLDARVVYYATSANDTNNGGTLWRSTNAGQSWDDISYGDSTSGGLHADTHTIAVSRNNPNILYTGNDGGIWRTNNAKAAADNVAWASLNNTLNITQFQMIALHPTSLDFLVGGTQDNGTNRYTGNASWSNLAEGDGGFAYIDQSNPKVVWHTFQNSSSATASRFGPRVTLDGTLPNQITWINRRCINCAPRSGGFNPTDRVGFYAPLAGHPGFTGEQGNVVYFGTMRLYRTADRGANFFGIGPSSDGFGTDLSKGQGRLTVIAPHPRLNPAQGSDPPGEVVWVGTNDGNIQVTTDAGKLENATWRNVTKAPLPNRFITDIGVDPNEQRRAIVVYSGFNANTPSSPGKVFLTNDQGGAWTDISGDLPDTPVNSVAVDPNQANTYYIGTDIGVFQTTNGGQNWVRLGSNLPRIAVFTVRYHAATKNLVIATHGRGIWRLALTAPTKAVATVSAASFSATAFAAESIAAAFGESLGTGVEVATTVPLPTRLAGSVVKVKDSAGVEREAPLFFVAPQQINYQIPPGTANGSATVTVTSGDGTISQGTINIVTAAPGWFTANANGQGVPSGYGIRVQANGAQSLELLAQAEGGRQVPRELDLGPEGDVIILVLFGTGFRGSSAPNSVSCRIGGENAEVQFTGAVAGLVGLDQANLRIPRSLIGRGVIDLLFMADGRSANTVQIRVK